MRASARSIPNVRSSWRIEILAASEMGSIVAILSHATGNRGKRRQSGWPDLAPLPWDLVRCRGGHRSVRAAERIGVQCHLTVSTMPSQSPVLGSRPVGRRPCKVFPRATGSCGIRLALTTALRRLGELGSREVHCRAQLPREVDERGGPDECESLWNAWGWAPGLPLGC